VPELPQIVIPDGMYTSMLACLFILALANLVVIVKGFWEKATSRIRRD
jgi:hypothetical protein